MPARRGGFCRGIRRRLWAGRAGAPPRIGDVESLLAVVRRASATRSQQRIQALDALVRAAGTPEERARVAAAAADVLSGRVRESPLAPLFRAFYRPLVVTLPTAVLVAVGLFVDDGRLTGQALSVTAGITLFITAALQVAGVPIYAPFSLAADREQHNRVRAVAASILGRMRPPEAAGVLARALSSRSSAVRGAAAAALREAAGAVSEEHYGRLPAEDVAALCRALDHADDGLVLAVLGALERAGSGAAARAVAWLAREDRSEQVRRAAERALPVLEERLRRETEARTLVRASHAAADGAAALLRPAAGAGAVDASVLVRPAGPGEEP